MNYEIIQKEENKKHISTKLNDIKKDLAYWSIRKAVAEKNIKELQLRKEKLEKRLGDCNV